MWADDSDEERPSFGRGGKGSKDYSAPIGFVSGGVKVGDKVTKEENEDDHGVSNKLKSNQKSLIQLCFVVLHRCCCQSQHCLCTVLLATWLDI